MKYFAFILFFIGVQLSYAQVKVEVISNVNPNELVLYTEHYNQLKLDGITVYPVTDILCNDRVLASLDNVFVYYPRVDEEGETELLLMSGTKLLTTIPIRIEKIKEPSIAITGFENTNTLTIEQFVYNDGLSVNYVNQGLISNFYVTGALISVLRGKKKVYSTVIYGNALSDKQMNKFEKLLRKGDSVIIGLCQISTFGGQSKQIDANLIYTIQ